MNSAIENEEENKEEKKLEAPKIPSAVGAVTLGGSSAVQGSTQSTQAQQTESEQGFCTHHMAHSKHLCLCQLVHKQR